MLESADKLLPELARLPPEFAVAYMRARGYVLPPTFDWREMWQEAHTTAFTVAKSAGYDILGDIHAALEKVLAEGRTFRDFSAELAPILQSKGWWGRAPAADPLTGEIRAVQLGSPRRLRVIYDTNLRTAQAAGDWVRIQAHAQSHPYLRYIVILDGHEREEHRRWHGTTLPVTHIWWITHYPPNGWFCRCTVMQLSPEDMEEFGYELTEAPPTKMLPWENARTGELLLVPDGIDPGFAYNVGQAALQEHASRALMGKLDSLPPRLAAEAMADSARFILPAVRRDVEAWITATASRISSGDRRVFNERRVVGALNKEQLDFLEARGSLPAAGGISIGDRDILHMQRPGKGARRWSAERLGDVPEILAHPKAVLWGNQVEGFFYVADGPADAPPRVVIVKVDTAQKAGRYKVWTNNPRTTANLSWKDLRNRGRYELIAGRLN